MAHGDGGRLIVLDATRGIAVMGILLINIISFAMPEAAYVNPLAWGGWDLADRIVWTINQLLFEGRMRGLFALLFGASAVLVMARAEAAGERPVTVHLRRMAVLALIGLAHCFLIWEGDVLFHYAVLGCVIWIGRGWPARRLLVIGGAVLLLHAIYWSSVFGGALYFQSIATAPGASDAMTAQYHAMLRGFPGPDNPSIARDLAVFRGDWAGIVADKLARKLWLPLDLLKYLGGETLGYMLIGMGLFASGLFTGRWSRARIVRAMLICYAASLPVIAALTWWSFASGFDRIVLMGNFLAWSIPFRMLCSIGHVCLIVLAVQRFATTRTVDRIAAAGRMAFTNYLMTSIVMTTIFYGFGLGLYGHVGRAEVYLFVLAMWALMLLWSQPWLARHRFGPFEWAWRSLARGRLQPMRRSTG